MLTTIEPEFTWNQIQVEWNIDFDRFSLVERTLGCGNWSRFSRNDYREHQTHPFSPINGEENDFSIIDLVKIMKLCEDGRDSLNNGRVMKRKGKIEEQKWRECENITRTKTICGASFLSLEF